jgi:hypothetical protein
MNAWPRNRIHGRSVTGRATSYREGQAVESAVRFMELHKKHWPGWEGETEVRQMFGPEDFGPENCAPKA